MKNLTQKYRSIGIFALVLVLLVSIVLPMSAAGSSVDDTMGTYIVQKGDTLASIAASHGVTVSDIVGANGVSASSELYVGQRLLIPGATSVDQDSTTRFGSASTISIDFKDADLFGALQSVIAQTDYTMISKGVSTDTKITLSLDNVSPITAIDYILRMADLSYIKNDNIVYVGTADTLNGTFIDSKALTRVTLKYISPDALMSQMSVLGMSVTVVKSDINLREFWISGYPMELAKMTELIDTLDNDKNTTVGSAKISYELTPIEMQYISADEFSSLLGALGLHTGITMSSHPMILYVYASGDAYEDIMRIKRLVDYADPNTQQEEGGEGEATTAAPGGSTEPTTSAPTDSGTGTGTGTGTDTSTEITNGEESLVKVELQYITKSDVREIVGTFGYDVDVLGLDQYEKIVWIRGESDEVNDAVSRIQEVDVAENDASRTSFEYTLTNITAAELQKKLAYVDLDDVQFYYGSYPSLTKSFMVYCPKNKVDHVKEVIASLDNNLGKMYYPIQNITDAAELSVLPAKEDLVVKLCNNPNLTTSAFELSDDLDPAGETVRYVLYVLESPENIDLLLDMWNRVG
ncbi:MAG: LysM peptidoglycan-binding domain-containing protein [Clostridia bacterium]|nr:LysM peptidoglycan-binding domain-containing protein [Clostridia bacterium]